MAIVALLDANVIWSAALRDLLLRIALAGGFQPAWSEEILAEMARTLVERRNVQPAAIARTISLMNRHFPTAMVTGYEQRIAAMLNDPGDRHVLAAAVEARATMLVTWNLRHFPPRACEPYGIDVETPDAFLCGFWQTTRQAIVEALTQQAADLQKPPQTPRDVLHTLQRTVPTFAAQVLDAQAF